MVKCGFVLGSCWERHIWKMMLFGLWSGGLGGLFERLQVRSALDVFAGWFLTSEG